MNKFYLVLGDWSDDGHGKSDKILLKSNKSVTEIQNAYKQSCKSTTCSFNHNDDFTGIKRDYKESIKYCVCSEYQQTTLTPEIIKIFKKQNCPFLKKLENDDYIVSQEIFVKLLMWFISLSLPDFKCEEIEDDIPVLNGYWDNNLNVQFGYGLYD